MSLKECGCPVVVAAEWEGRSFDWEGRSFYVEKVPYFFRLPIGLEAKMLQTAETIEKKGIITEDPVMVLQKDGLFSGEILVAVLPPENADPNIVTFPRCRIEASVYERKDPRVWPGLRSFRARLAAQGKRVGSFYVWHVCCPRCATGEGYKTILFARIA